MLVALLATLNLAKNKSTWSAHVAFSSAVSELDEIVKEIEACAKCQATKDGASDAKLSALEALGDIAFEVAAGVKAYASKQGDRFLAGKVDFSRSKLTSGSASKVIARTQTIFDAATEVIDELADQQVTPAKLKKLENRIKNFGAVHSKPRQTTAASNAATRRLPKLFRTAAKILTEQLDGLAVQFKGAQPAFYLEFQAARSIIEQATGRAADGANATPAASVTPPAKAA